MNLQRLFFSHYVYNGVGGAVGVFLAGVIGYLWGGWGFAGALSIGAVAVHVVDAPCPPSLKIRQVVPILLVNVLITALVMANQALWWQLLCVMLITMSSSLLSAFGKAAAPYSFSLLYAMIMAMAVPVAPHWGSIFMHLLQFCVGGTVYVVYVLGKEYLLELRSKQQILAECLHEFSGYLRLQSQLFGGRREVETSAAQSLYVQLIRQQAVLTEKLQASRDILFLRIRPEHGGYLSATLFAVFDAYEGALSSQADVKRLLQQHVCSTPVLSILGQIILRSADDLDVLAESVMRNSAPQALPDYSGQLAQAAEQIELLARGEGRPATIVLLRELLEKVTLMLGHIVRLSQTTCSPDLSSKEGGGSVLELDQEALLAFVSPSFFRRDAFETHLQRNSPAMRFTWRMTMAMLAGALIAEALPYGAHSYWVLLTIAVIMRSSFSQTKQRSTDRMIGTVLGCVIAIGILFFSGYPFFMLTCLFLATAVARAMTTVRFRYTATAATIMGMLLINMLNPGEEFLIVERLIDTVVGVGLAYVFSFVLPNWEHRSLPEQVQQLSDSCLTYARQALAMNPSAKEYRLTRRQFHDTLAAFSQTIDRMLDEPKFSQMPLTSLEVTATQGYLLAAQMASVRALLTTQAKVLDEPQTEEALEQTCAQIVLTLEQPRGAPRRSAKKSEPEAAPQIFELLDQPVAPKVLLHRRLELICQEAIPFAAALKRVLKSHRRLQKKFSDPF